MSDILILGMEMPKEGSWKTVRIYPDGTCAVPNWQGDCTLIQGAKAVPVPSHGDLIDRNELIQSVSEDACDCNPDHFDLDDKDGYGKWMLHNGINTGIVAARVRIKGAPTIIEEER